MTVNVIIPDSKSGETLNALIYELHEISFRLPSIIFINQLDTR